MSIGLLSHKASEGALSQGSLPIISMATSRTTGCPICSSLVGANIAENHSPSWNNFEKKCIVCGKNCGKPALLDLFSGAGGAARGYQRAGFCVLGVDIKPHPHYAGCRFHQADAMTYPLDGFDVIHASPPCQAYCRLRHLFPDKHYPDLIDAVRERLVKINNGMLWVIENVPKSPLRNPILLCGSSFALRVRRHRLFESNVQFLDIPLCNHKAQGAPLDVSGNGGRRIIRKANDHGGRINAPRNIAEARQAMGIDWMNRDELSQAIPPAYTFWIGKQLMEYLRCK